MRRLAELMGRHLRLSRPGSLGSVHGDTCQSVDCVLRNSSSTVQEVSAPELSPVAGFRRRVGIMPGDASCSASKQRALYHIVMYV